jgi:hypothetical protein
MKMLKDEIYSALHDRNYSKALTLSLTIPNIKGHELYPELSEKDSYIKWFDKNIAYSYTAIGETNITSAVNGNTCYELYRVSLGQITFERSLVSWLRLRVDESILIIRETYIEKYDGMSLIEKYDCTPFATRVLSEHLIEVVQLCLDIIAKIDECDESEVTTNAKT